jgi:hypothetical protein
VDAWKIQGRLNGCFDNIEKQVLIIYSIMVVMIQFMVMVIHILQLFCTKGDVL